MVPPSASWWRRRWNGETPTDALESTAPLPLDGPADAQDVWVAIGRLPRRQRAGGGGAAPPAATAACGGGAAVPGGPHRGRDGDPDGLFRRHGQEPVREGA